MVRVPLRLMPAPESRSLRDVLRAALIAAMKRQDRAAVSACRTALAAVANAEALPVDTVPAAGAVELAPTGVGGSDAPRRELTEGQVRDIVATEIAERRAAAEALPPGQSARRRALVDEADVLDDVLSRVRGS